MHAQQQLARILWPWQVGLRADLQGQLKWHEEYHLPALQGLHRNHATGTCGARAPNHHAILQQGPGSK